MAITNSYTLHVETLRSIMWLTPQSELNSYFVTVYDVIILTATHLQLSKCPFNCIPFLHIFLVSFGSVPDTFICIYMHTWLLATLYAQQTIRVGAVIVVVQHNNHSGLQQAFFTLFYFNRSVLTMRLTWQLFLTRPLILYLWIVGYQLRMVYTSTLYQPHFSRQ